jgi:hypothetical protein
MELSFYLFVSLDHFGIQIAEIFSWLRGKNEIFVFLKYHQFFVLFCLQILIALHRKYVFQIEINFQLPPHQVVLFTCFYLPVSTIAGAIDYFS